MAVTVTDLRTIRDEADGTGGWQGSPNLFTSNPDPVEATGSIGYVVSNATVDAYHVGGSVDLSNALVYVWVRPFGAMDTIANGGVALILDDGTNRVGFHLAGSNVAVFQHADGPVEWQCLVLDTTNLPSQHTVRAGSLGGLNLAAITGIGAMFKTLFKSVGGVSNCFVDIMRHGSGPVLRITEGTSGDPGVFGEIAAFDRSTANQRAHGVVRVLGAGLLGVQGPLQFGHPTSGNTYFLDRNVTVVFEARGLATTRYRIEIVRGSGTTHFQLGEKVGADGGEDGCTIAVPPGVGAEFDADTETDPTDVLIYASVLRGFTNGVGLQAGHELIDSQVDASGTVRANGATMVNSRFTGSLADSAVLWDSDHDTASRLDGCSFAMGESGHGLELGPGCPSEITLIGVSWGNYGAGGTTDAAIYNNSGKEVTINLVGGSSPTVRNGAGASTILQVSATHTLTGLVQGSRVTYVLSGTETDVFEEPSVGAGGTTAFPYTEPMTVDIFIHALQYVPIELIGIELTGVDASIPITQAQDRWYSA